MGWKYSKKRYKSIGERTVSGKPNKGNDTKRVNPKDCKDYKCYFK